MPCGGIFPSENEAAQYKNNHCWHCQKNDPLPDHFVLEWDAFIHGKCVEAFLMTQEGLIVLSHGHEVIVRGEDGVDKTLHEGS